MNENETTFNAYENMAGAWDYWCNACRNHWMQTSINSPERCPICGAINKNSWMTDANKE